MTDSDTRFSFQALLDDLERGAHPDVDEAYQWCTNLARSHYENFPVVSFLLPRPLRRHVAAIYAFARVADDIADEPGLEPEERISMLRRWRGALHSASRGQPAGSLFVALAETIGEFHLPIELFEDLLDAFEYDSRNRGFETMDDLLAYAAKSANPIGRLLLHLFDETARLQFSFSDNICTGLQLVNFWQDLSGDLVRGRFNIPGEILGDFGVSQQQLIEGVRTDHVDAMVLSLVAVARGFLVSGSPLPASVAAVRFGRQLRSTIAGGLAMCDKIERLGGSVIHTRPSIGKVQALRILIAP
jgi:squalene synthase HpnC